MSKSINKIIESDINKLSHATITETDLNNIRDKYSCSSDSDDTTYDFTNTKGQIIYSYNMP